MRTIILATHNAHKREELAELLAGRAEVLSLADLHIDSDIPETGSSFAENALQKARFVARLLGPEAEILADDSGLEVAALGGAPGIYSARYAGPGCSSADNNAKLLAALRGVEDRRARFVTVLALVQGDLVRYFRGEVRGTIIREGRGTEGFGYDPLFVPEGETRTFAELPAEVKNSISHRGRAIRLMMESL